MTAETAPRPPFRDTIREVNSVERARDNLAEYEAKRGDLISVDYAVWTGRFAATVDDLLKVIKNLRAVADHAEGGEL